MSCPQCLCALIPPISLFTAYLCLILMSNASIVLRLLDNLSNFEYAGSLVDDPNRWQAANISQINLAINASPVLAYSGLTLLMEAPCLFPRCFAYMFTHMKLTANDTTLLKALEEKQRQWGQEDIVNQLIHQSSIGGILWDFVRRCENASFHACSCRDDIKKLVNIDITSIAARILAIISDPSRKGQFLLQQAIRAQSLLDLLQSLLDTPNFDSATRLAILSLLVDLSKRSRLYPRCLYLRGVRRLGQDPVDFGGFGDIWRGQVHRHDIAIKVVRKFSSDSEVFLKSILREAVLWRQFSHPHVLPFYGVCCFRDTPDRVSLVSPWMENGNVVRFLKRNPQANRRSLLLDVACGLQYLHSLGAIHGDLKGSNVLVTSDLRACLTDFGASLVPDCRIDLTRSSSLNTGALRWQAPELLHANGEHKHWKSWASDMYAFGCVGYEMLAGKPPFHQLTDFQVLNQIANGKRPTRPETSDNDICRDDLIWYLAVRCWENNPHDRPKASDMVSELSSHTTVVEAQALVDAALLGNFYRPLIENPLFALGVPKAQVSHDDDLNLIAGDDILIVLMGQTGSGKSSFINIATGQEWATVGHGLHSCTQDIRAYRCPRLHKSGRTVLLVDTPAFDDSERGDFKILEDITEWLAKTYKERIFLSGILFFHDISEPRMGGTPLKNFATFKALCGEDALSNVILTTTMWDTIDEVVGQRMESQLRAKFWKKPLLQGCRMDRFLYTSESAWDIINAISGETPRAVKLQVEVVDKGLPFAATTAFTALRKWWESITAPFRNSRPSFRRRKTWKSRSSRSNTPDNESISPFCLDIDKSSEPSVYSIASDNWSVISNIIPSTK